MKMYVHVYLCMFSSETPGVIWPKLMTYNKKFFGAKIPLPTLWVVMVRELQ